jgi:uncharacterized membrane protein HdeD (DUF308 family)
MKGVFPMAKKKNSNLSSALLYIVIGVLLFLFPGDALKWAMTIGGAFFVICGIADLLRKYTSSGLMNLIIGLVILLGGWLFLDIVLLVLGILIAIKGIFALLDALRGKKSVIGAIFAIISIAVGALLVFGNTAQTLATILKIAGVLLAVDGVLGLFSGRKA